VDWGDGRSLSLAVDEFLRHAHTENAVLPIRHPGPTGAFPDATFAGLIREECLLVVPDTNILLQDIADACKRGKRLTLVTAANAGAIRLICARHVIEEVSEHCADFAEQQDLNPDIFLLRWQREYLPQLRMIPDGSIPEGVLTPQEMTRVQRLNESKDVQSVVLAISLGAFYLTKDKPAWESVYDEKAHADEMLKWLEPVRGGNTADELGKFGFAALLVPALAFDGIGQAFGAIRRNAAWAFIPITAGLAYAAYRIPRTRYKGILSGLGYAAEVFMEFRTRYETAMERFRKMAPPVPTWEELADSTPRQSVLLRACLATLARSPYSQRSAVELAQKLPCLGVGQSAPLVREALRANSSFSQPYRGRWQVGWPCEVIHGRIEPRIGDTIARRKGGPS
jgi:predicted nucleic acid-binding protein